MGRGDHYRKAKEEYGYAQVNKKHYESEYLPKLKKLEEDMMNAIRNRDTYSNKLSSYEGGAKHIANEVQNKERALQDINKSLQANLGEYESNLSLHQGEVNKFNQQGATLQSLVDVFKKEAPDFSKAIEEYQNLPKEFLSKFEQHQAKRKELAGFSRNDSGAEIDQYESGVNELKDKRSELEKIINEKYGSLSQKQKELLGKHQEINSALNEHKSRHGQLLEKENAYNQKRSGLESIINNYKLEENKYNSEVNKANQIKTEYDEYAKRYSDNEANIAKFSKDFDEQDKARGIYQNAINKHLENARYHEGKANKRSFLESMLPFIPQREFAPLNIHNIALTGKKYDPKPLLSRLPSVALGKNAPISSGMLGNAPKLNIPQLGGLQSPQHFGIDQMPEISKLPDLAKALGSLKDPKDLNDLTLGLPKFSGKNGKSYNFQVLLDPKYLEKFKNTVKKVGRYGSNNNRQTVAS